MPPAGGITAVKFGSLEDDCRSDVCPTGYEGDIDSGKAAQVAANVGAIVGAVGLTVGVGLFIWSKADEASEEGVVEEKKEPPPPEVAIGPGSIVIRGSF